MKRLFSNFFGSLPLAPRLFVLIFALAFPLAWLGHHTRTIELYAWLGLSPLLVWKTNAHASAQARELLDGMFDVWLADYKFGNDSCARRLAKVPNYNRIVRENLVWANHHCELIVRHLLMPHHVECCWRPVAKWLAENLPGVKVNLRSGF